MYLFFVYVLIYAWMQLIPAGLFACVRAQVIGPVDRNIRVSPSIPILMERNRAQGDLSIGKIVQVLGCPLKIVLQLLKEGGVAVGVPLQ
jgi:hypothetical protein